MLQLRHLLNLNNIRCYSSALPKYSMEHLKGRSLLRIAGLEVPEFLQGLITNDIHHLDNGVGSMYTMFLNTKGRVLYDTILYRTPNENSYLIECDKEVVESLAKHLKLYRVRRKIDISNLKDEYAVYSLFNTEQLSQNSASKERKILKPKDGFIVPCTSLSEVSPKECTMYRDLLIFCDPRLSELGLRVIAPLKSDIQQQISEMFCINNINKVHTYRWLRYNLGVGEGITDLPSGNCFPLEANCDYLHGISFHKGCYIGQELTARTHHTGVVRKRLMPLYFSQSVTESPADNTIMHDNVNLGKLRGFEENVGLGLLRIAKALEYKHIKVGDGLAETVKPLWWPLEAPKEKMSSKKG